MAWKGQHMVHIPTKFPPTTGTGGVNFEATACTYRYVPFGGINGLVTGFVPTGNSAIS